MICTVLFLVAAVLLVWFIVEHNNQRGWLVASTVLIGVEFLLFLIDVKILHGEISN